MPESDRFFWCVVYFLHAMIYWPERMMRIMKEALISSNDWQSHDKLTSDLGAWVEEYNTRYCHSALGYQPPTVFEKHQLLLNQKTSLVAA